MLRIFKCAERRGRSAAITASFELQAAFRFDKDDPLKMRGRLEWYDGDRKIGEQLLADSPAIEPMFLNRAAETPGVHFYRARFVPATDYVPQAPSIGSALFQWAPPGESAPSA